MTPHNFPELLNDKIAESIAEKSGQIALGMASDWPNYQRRIGVIEGLKELQRVITELTEDKDRK